MPLFVGWAKARQPRRSHNLDRLRARRAHPSAPPSRSLPTRGHGAMQELSFRQDCGLAPSPTLQRFRKGLIWRASLVGAGLLVLIHGRASAFTAYVSNEKSNTVSVIDTDKLALVKTIKVGQRPRGIEVSRDGKFILVAVGDDD